MFFERLLEECKKRKTNVTNLCKSIGIGTSNGTYWKKGSIPNGEILVKISEFLNVSIDYLLTGKTITPQPASDRCYLQMRSTSQKIDYKNKVLHLKDDSFFARFKEAREAAGISLEEAASGAFLSMDVLRILEEDDIPTMEIDARMQQVQEIGWEQLSYLAYKYNVDLYWLLCGKVRPPAAVVQDGQLVYPPYEFMMEASQQPKEDTPKKNGSESGISKLTVSEVAERIESLFGKKQVSFNDDFDNVYPTDPEYNMNVSWAAASGAQGDPVKNEAMQKILRLHEKRGRLINEEMQQQKKEVEEK